MRVSTAVPLTNSRGPWPQAVAASVSGTGPSVLTPGRSISAISSGWSRGGSKVMRSVLVRSSAKVRRPLLPMSPSRTVFPVSSTTRTGRVTVSPRGNSTVISERVTRLPKSTSREGRSSAGSGYQTVASSPSKAARPIAAGWSTEVEEEVTFG